MRPGALYRSIRTILNGFADVSSVKESPIEIRLLGGTHPHIDLYITGTVRGVMSSQTLSIARHCEGTLERGFLEGDTSGDIWMRG